MNSVCMRRPAESSGYCRLRASATRSGGGSCSRISLCSCLRQIFEDRHRVVGFEVAHALAPPSSDGSSSRISSRTASSTSVSAVKSKSMPSSSTRRGRCSGSSASSKSPRSASCRSPTSLRNAPASAAAIPRATLLTKVLRMEPSLLRGTCAGSASCLFVDRACRESAMTYKRAALVRPAFAAGKSFAPKLILPCLPRRRR